MEPLIVYLTHVHVYPRHAYYDSANNIIIMLVLPNAEENWDLSLMACFIISNKKPTFVLIAKISISLYNFIGFQMTDDSYSLSMMSYTRFCNKMQMS